MTRSRLAKAAIWSIGGSGLQYAVSFLLLVYLAHQLAPSDFGLIATVSIGLDLGIRVARWGQVELLQQERYRTEAARNQSLKLALAVGLVFALAFVLLAVPVGRLYHSSLLTLMMFVSAPVFLFSAGSSTAEALLRIEYRFNVIAVRNSVTTLIGAVIAVLLVSGGYGVMALAVQRVIQAAIACFWVWQALDWRPTFRQTGTWSRGLFQEGTHVMLGTLMPLLVPRSVDLFVGFFMGPAQLGLMRVGMRINDFVGQLVVVPLVSVANTQFSTLADRPDQMRATYLRLTQASALLMAPALVGLSLVAGEAIPLLFGAKWTGSVPFVQIVGLLGLVAPINYYFAPTMMALGRSRLVFRQGLLQVVLGVVLAAGGAWISLAAVAVAHVVRGTIVAFWNLLELRGGMELRLREVAAALAPPYLGTFAMAASVLGTRHFVVDHSPLLRLVLLSVTGALTYALVVGLGERLGFWQLAHGLVSRRKSPARAMPQVSQPSL